VSRVDQVFGTVLALTVHVLTSISASPRTVPGTAVNQTNSILLHDRKQRLYNSCSHYAKQTVQPLPPEPATEREKRMVR
jgi:hypothetical protein